MRLRGRRVFYLYLLVAATILVAVIAGASIPITGTLTCGGPGFSIVNACNQPIPNAADPVNPQDVVNLRYLQNHSAGVSFVYQPGGTAAGNVFTSEAALDTAINAVQGAVTVVIDVTHQPSGIATLAASPSFTNPITFIGQTGFEELTITGTTTFQQISFVSLSQINFNTSSGPNLMVGGAGVSNSGGSWMQFINAPVLSTGSSSTAAIVTQHSFNVTIYAYNSGFISGGGAVFDESGGPMSVFLYAGSGINSSAATIGTGSRGLISYDDTMTTAPITTSAWTSTALGKVANLSYSPATPGNWSPVPSFGAPALDQLATRVSTPQSVSTPANSDMQAGAGATTANLINYVQGVSGDAGVGYVCQTTVMGPDAGQNPAGQALSTEWPPVTTTGTTSQVVYFPLPTQTGICWFITFTVKDADQTVLGNVALVQVPPFCTDRTDAGAVVSSGGGSTGIATNGPSYMNAINANCFVDSGAYLGCNVNPTGIADSGTHLHWVESSEGRTSQ